MNLAALVPGRQPKSYNRPARGRRVTGRVGGWLPFSPVAGQRILETILKVTILRRKSGVALL